MLGPTLILGLYRGCACGLFAQDNKTWTELRHIIDPDGYRAYVMEREQAFRRELERQKK